MAYFNNKGAFIHLVLTPEFQAKVDEYKKTIQELKDRLALLSISPLTLDQKKAVNALTKSLKRISARLDRAAVSAHVDNTLKDATLKNVSFNRDVYSLEECGYVLGKITRERVRQIESLAIKKLKHPKIGREIKNYLSLGDNNLDFNI